MELKWPKYKSSLLLERPEGGLDNAVPSTQHVSEGEEENSSELRNTFPNYIRSGGRNHPMSKARPVPADADPMGISDEDLGTEDDRLVYFSDRTAWEIGHLFPTSTFTEHGIVTCPERPGADGSSTLYQLLPEDIFHGLQQPASPSLFTDQDVMDRSDPSRFPPLVEVQVPQARLAIE